MLIMFSCNAYEKLTFFADVAQKLLKLMGQSGATEGALRPEDVADALDHLEKGVARLKGEGGAVFHAQEDDGMDVSLATRAVPLLGMLRAALKSHSYVMWQVK